MSNLQENDLKSQPEAGTQPSPERPSVFWRLLRVLRQAVMVVLLLVTLLFGWFSWQPPDLTPYAQDIARFLSEQSGLQIRLQGLSLRLGGMMALSGEGVELRAPGHPDTLTARNLLVRFSPLALIHQLPPLEAELVGLTLPIHRDQSGRVTVVGAGFLEAKKTDQESPFLFSHVSLKDLLLLFDDEGHHTATGEPLRLGLETVTLNTMASHEGQISFHGSGTLNIQGTPLQKLALKGERDEQGAWRIDLQADAIHLAPLKSYLIGYPPLSGIDFPMKIDATLRLSERGAVAVEWSLLAENGELFWPELFRWPLPIGFLAAQGVVTSTNGHSWDLKVSRFDLTNEHGIANGALTLTNLGGDGSPVLDLIADAAGVPSNKANYYYPTTIMSPALVHWLDTSLDQGYVKQARATIRGAVHNLFNLEPQVPGEAPSIFRIEADVVEASLQFYPGIPPLTQVVTHLVFDGLSMEAAVETARLRGSHSVQGFVRIENMMHTVVEIDAHGHADLATLWSDVIAAPQLRLDRMIGLEGTALEGGGALTLNMALPVENMASLQYDGTIQIRDATLRLSILPVPITAFNGRLHLIPKRLDLDKASGIIEGQSVQGVLEVGNYWTPPKSSLNLTLNNVVANQRLLEWLAPLTGEEGMAQGDLPIELQIDRNPKDGVFHFDLRGDGGQLETVGRLGWNKAGGTEGAVRVQGRFDQDGTLLLEDVKANLGNLSAHGHGVAQPKSGDLNLQLDAFKVDRTQGKLAVEQKGGQWHIAMDADTIALFDETHPKEKDGEEEDEELFVKARAPVPPLYPRTPETYVWPSWPVVDLKVKADRVILADGEIGKNLALRLKSRERGVELEQFSLLMGAGETAMDGFLDWRDHPDEGPYTGRLTIHSKDAGTLLRGFDWHPGLVGGKAIIAIYLDGIVPPGGQLANHLRGKGTVDMEKGVIQRLQLLSTLLGLFSLRDLPSLLLGERPDLKGDGFYYNTIHGEFTLDAGVWKSERLQLKGPSMTIIVSGLVDYARDDLKLLVGMRPWQTLDKLINQIPLLGKLAVGTRESVFETSFNVTGDLDDPDIYIRPVSSLAPGVLRDILNLPALLWEMAQQGVTVTGGSSTTGGLAPLNENSSSSESGSRQGPKFTILDDPFSSNGVGQ